MASHKKYRSPHPGRAQRAGRVSRPKDFGIEHRLWLLERHEEKKAAAKEDDARMKEYEEKGVRHSATLYFGRAPTRSESASLSRACKILTDSGEAVRYPRIGKMTHLRLTPLGFRKARELRKNGGCSPREIDEAVRASSRPLRETLEYQFYNASWKTAVKDFINSEATHEQLNIAYGKVGLLQMEVDRVERCCRDYLASLPLDQKRAEVKRLKNGGRWEAPPMFTDGGTEPWPPAVADMEDRVLS